MIERVSIGEARIGRAPVILKAYGLGSCVAVGLFDREAGVGGLGHMLLPERPVKNPLGSECKYVDAGILRMVQEMELVGAVRERLVAKVAGGANMFEATYQTLMSSIGTRNAMSARDTLARLAIPLVGEEVGGNRGRTVEFDLEGGLMTVICPRNEERISL